MSSLFNLCDFVEQGRKTVYLFKRKDTPYWWATFMRKRKRFQFSTKETDRQKAASKAKIMRQEIMREKGGKAA